MFEDNHTIIIGRDLNDTWRNSLWACTAKGREYIIEKGSYKGQIRRQLPHATVIVEYPGTRPFIFYTPDGVPSPTNEEKIHDYFYKYIISEDKTEQEDYTYGSQIAPQINGVINILNEAKGNTNQACINIGGIENIYMDDPPCLRMIDFKVVNNQLTLFAFFRSWDCFAAMPENLGGLQCLKEYVGMHLNFPYEDGQLIVFSSGLHLYEMYFPIVNCLNIEQIEIKETS